MSNSPEDWTKWLTLATVVHNNRVNETTGLAPNEILLGFMPCANPSEEVHLNNDLVEERAEFLKRRRGLAI